MTVPPIFGVAGYSGSGKTHLLERLIPALSATGLRVGVIKHCRHIDRSGSARDSDRFARSGASPVIASAGQSLEIQNAEPAPMLLDLADAFCNDCDLVLVEGFSDAPHDKILLTGPDHSRPPRHVRAVQLVVGEGEQIDRDDTDAITEWILTWHERRTAARAGLLGAVLTGGASSRMGCNKSALEIAGRRVLGRLCELLADRIGEAIIVGGQPGLEGIPRCVRWHRDIASGQGPLGGIATALRIAAAGREDRGVCVLACDMPAIGGGVLDCLLTGRDRGAPATVLLNPTTGKLEPLVGIYEAGALGSIEESLQADRRSATQWLTGGGAHPVTVPAEAASQLVNVNTPEELEAIRSQLEQEEA